MGAVVQLLLGATFGVILLRTGAADFDAIVRMFAFEEAHLFALSAVATAVAALGLWLLARSPAGAALRGRPRAVHWGSIPGGLLFGVGWGLSGSCPGTVLAQLGSGRLIAACTVVGVLLGNWLFERFVARRVDAPVDSCG